MTTPSEQHSKPIRLADAALTAALDDQWDKASRYLQRINDECGPDTASTALQYWVDQLADHITDGHPVGSIRSIQAMAYETGQLTPTVPPRIDWAQRVVKARAEMDRPAFEDLVRELFAITDGSVRGAYVGAVCEVAALTIRAFPRGYAAKGQGASRG